MQNRNRLQLRTARSLNGVALLLQLNLCFFACGTASTVKYTCYAQCTGFLLVSTMYAFPNENSTSAMAVSLESLVASNILRQML